jgi:hypothetical protein
MSQSIQWQPQVYTPTSTSSRFHEDLLEIQPEVVSWFEEHLSEGAQGVAIELAARYFEITERWGEQMPHLRQARLNLELQSQMPKVGVADWSVKQVSLSESESRMLKRMLQALVSVSQHLI